MSVYTHLDYFQISEFAARHGIERVHSVAPVEGGVENTIYRLETDRGALVLTLFERESFEKAERIARLVAELGRRGVPVPEVFPPVGTLAEKPALLARFVEGILENAPDAEELTGLGEALGVLHREGADLGGDLGDGPHLARVLSPMAEALSSRLGHKSPVVAELLVSEAALQRGLPERDLPGGLLHADLFPDNVIFDPQTCRVKALLDFQMAGRGPWLYDLAVCIANGAWDGERLDGDRVRAILAGYRSFRPLEPEEIRLLPAYLRRAALRFLCFRLEKWLAAATPEVGRTKNPAEQAEKLKAFRALAK